MSEVASDGKEARRVLVVEDEHEVCNVLADALEAEGLQPVCVRNDQQALQQLRRDSGFACIIVDINLGLGTTGFDVARVARQLDPTLPVVYVSGHASEASFHANGVPGSLFLSKPFTPDELLESVRKLVGDNDG